MTETLFDRIKRHEGFCEFPRPDNQFKGNSYVIGYGCDITPEEAKTTYANGISYADANYLLSERLNKVEEQLFAALPWLIDLPDDDRINVMIEMAFQLGVQGVLEFKNTLAFVKAGDYADAAKGMLNSKWHLETPARCEELANIMLNNS